MPLLAQETAGAHPAWVQDNVSLSHQGVLRGLHFQHPQGQAKLVTVLAGRIFDVAVDIRRGSPGFGRAFSYELAESEGAQLHIPPGFAHGFLVLSESAVVHYRCDKPWYPAGEKTILWNDPALRIDWPLQGSPVLSEKDASGHLLGDFQEDELPPAAC